MTQTPATVPADIEDRGSAAGLYCLGVLIWGLALVGVILNIPKMDLSSQSITISVVGFVLHRLARFAKSPTMIASFFDALPLPSKTLLSSFGWCTRRTLCVIVLHLSLKLSPFPRKILNIVRLTTRLGRSSVTDSGFSNYHIKVAPRPPSSEFEEFVVLRRFRAFKELKAQLAAETPPTAAPALPDDGLWSALNSTSASLRAERQAQLSDWCGGGGCRFINNHNY